MLCLKVVLPVLAILSSASAAPYDSSLKLRQSALNTTGFLDPVIDHSQGSNAICISGIIPVEASTTDNVHLNISSTLSSQEVTQLILNLGIANSDYVATVTGSPSSVSGTWNISARLCYPAKAPDQSATEVQLLTHGVGFEQSYWDFPNPGHSGSGNYSYVDAAALANRTSFTYDRLGIGNSSHPDPIQVVQGPLEVEILHNIVAMLREGQLAGQKFDTIVGIGHSYGSALTTGVTNRYPQDFDAVVLTGFSSNVTGGVQFTSGLNLLSAAKADAARFAGLPDGYLLPSTESGVQYAFFSYPDFQDDVLVEAFQTIQTTTVGEQLTMEHVLSETNETFTNFTGPVFMLDGSHDLFFCDGNCTYPENILEQTLSEIFRHRDMAKSGWSLLQGSGHGVNFALNASVAFEAILAWIKSLTL